MQENIRNHVSDNNKLEQTVEKLYLGPVPDINCGSL